MLSARAHRLFGSAFALLSLALFVCACTADTRSQWSNLLIVASVVGGLMAILAFHNARQAFRNSNKQ